MRDRGLGIRPGGQGVQASGLKIVMAHPGGHREDVRAGPDQVSPERMPQGLRGDGRLSVLLEQAGVYRELADEVADRPGGQPGAAAADEQGWGISTATGRSGPL